MNTDNLYEFAEIAKRESFSEAAEELCISQSSLSKHLRHLEESLGVVLLERSSRAVRLTDTGKALLPYITLISEAEQNIRRICKDQETRRLTSRRPLHLASVPVMSVYGIPEYIASFQALHPEILLTIEEREPAEVPPLFENGKCEIAFLRESGRLYERYRTVDIMREKVIAVLPVGHPLSRNSCISLEQLRDEKFLFITSGAILYGICMNLCISVGFVPDIIFTARRPENIIELVSRGMGVSIISESYYHFYQKEKTVGLPLSPTAEMKMVMACPRHSTLSPEAQLFWDYVCENRPSYLL